MICPKCGNELKPGTLYCEECGEEIKIVPEFDPEIENSITQILNDVADAAKEEIGIMDDVRVAPEFDPVEESEKQDKKDYRKDVRLVMIMGFAFLGILVIFSFVWLILNYKYSNYDYQLKKAKQYVSEGDLVNAADTYRHILEIKKNDPLATYYLANVNLAMEDEEGALLLYKEIVADDDADTDLKYNSCKSIVDIYVSREDYQSISDFLAAIGDNDITDSFQKYKCKEPEFSYNEGTYDTVIPLKLTSDTSGNIYYTLDGTDPTTGSDIYSSPIFLETGDYEVRAFIVNSFGVASRVVTKAYHIDITDTTAPEVLTYSGDYDTPTFIEVEVLDDCRVFYTTDGTDPTNESLEYRNPINMPLGKSEFKFVSYSKDGVASEITTRNYNLVLKSAITIAEAQNRITQGMLEAGKIYEMDGRSMEIFGRYLYLYQYVTNIEGAGDFYIIAEVMEDTEGIRSRTGALFAVSLKDGKRYRLGLDNDNKYVFTEF